MPPYHCRSPNKLLVLTLFPPLQPQVTEDAWQDSLMLSQRRNVSPRRPLCPVLALNATLPQAPNGIEAAKINAITHASKNLHSDMEVCSHAVVNPTSSACCVINALSRASMTVTSHNF